MAALKERLNADELADELIKRSKQSDALLMYLFNRVEGMPHQTATTEHMGEMIIREYAGFVPGEVE